MQRPTIVRLSIFLATVVAAWGVLSLGVAATEDDLIVGQPAPQDFDAERAADAVVDAEQTSRLEQEARDSVDEALARQRQPEIEISVQDSVSQVFDDIESMVVGDDPASPTTTIPVLPLSTTTPTQGTGESTTTTVAPLPALITGRVFIDVDENGVFNAEGETSRVDRGLERVDVQIRIEGDVSQVRTGADGVWSAEIPEGAVVVTVDASDPEIPESYFVGTDNLGQLLECGEGETCLADDVGFVVNLRSSDEVSLAIAALHPLPGDTIDFLVESARRRRGPSGLE